MRRVLIVGLTAIALSACGSDSGVAEASGGGGSGGGILIHAFSVTVEGDLIANGGHASSVNDHSYSGGGGGGRILLAHDQSGLYDITNATISKIAGQAGAGSSTVTPSANGLDGAEGVFTEVETQATTTADSYTYSIELLDSGGGLLELMIDPEDITPYQQLAALKGKGKPRQV